VRTTLVLTIFKIGGLREQPRYQIFFQGKNSVLKLNGSQQFENGQENSHKSDLRNFNIFFQKFIILYTFLGQKNRH
jgi:hypothetical protein